MITDITKPKDHGDKVAIKYPTVFSTADMAVLHKVNRNEIYVLLGKKKPKDDEPPETHWVFPGGFADPVKDECIYDTAIRELEEKTGIPEDWIDETRCIWDGKIANVRYEGTAHCIFSNLFMMMLDNSAIDFDESSEEELEEDYFAHVKVTAQDDIAELKWFDLSGFQGDFVIEDYIKPVHRPLMRALVQEIW